MSENYIVVSSVFMQISCNDPDISSEYLPHGAFGWSTICDYVIS